jgi:hypothetical protein
MNSKIASVLIISMLFGIACSDIPQTGIIKNTTNGVVTTYSSIKPEGAILIMNDEELNHNQIPLGEEFILINHGVSGFTEVDHRVSVGGELTIRSKAGDVLLHMEDMYKQNSSFHKDSIGLLRCYVSTGRPMNYDEKYDVNVRFWDKLGDGEIINHLEIEIIDLP